jgi:hypothetical protein
MTTFVNKTNIQVQIYSWQHKEKVKQTVFIPSNTEYALIYVSCNVKPGQKVKLLDTASNEYAITFVENDKKKCARIQLTPFVDNTFFYIKSEKFDIDCDYEGTVWKKPLQNPIPKNFNFVCKTS